MAKRRKKQTKNNNSRKGNKSTKKRRSSKEETPKSLLLLVGLALISIAFAVPLIVEPETVTKLYTNGLFKVVRVALGSISQLVPFSLTEVFAVLLAVVILVLIIVGIIKLFAKTATWKGFFGFICVLVLIVGIAWNWFNICYGLNYQAEGLVKQLNITKKEYTAQELYNLCVMLRDKANENREYVPSDSRGIFTVANELDTFKRVAIEVMSNPLNHDGRKVYTVKKSGLGDLMSKLGISGIYMPFFAEATVNVNEPSLLLAATAAHESAHSIGIANEAEANLAAFIICSEAQDPGIRYSGYALALMYCADELYTMDKELYNQLTDGYDSRVIEDFKDYYAYTKQNSSVISKASNATNDLYLKLNGVDEGAESYNEVVKLLMGYC